MSVVSYGQRNSVIDHSQCDYFDATDTIPLLFRFTEKDTIINDTLGTIKYLIKENQRLYDLLEKKDKMFLDISTTVSGLMMYIPKREKFYTL
jgi:hypothetical protein